MVIKKLTITSLLLFAVLLFGCVSSSNQNTNGAGESSVSTSFVAQAIESCKRTDATPFGDAYSVPDNCLYRKSATPSECKAFEGTKIFEFQSPFSDKPTINYYSENNSAECITSLAAGANKTQFCDEISNSSMYKDKCYLILANNNFQPQICAKATDSRYCYQEIISAHPDEIHQRCSNISSRSGLGGTACLMGWLGIVDHDSCVKNFADESLADSWCWALLGILKNDTALCDKGKGETRDFRIQCYFVLAYNGIVGINDCNRLGPDYMGCYNQVAVRSKNSSLCYFLDNSTARLCISQVALAALDLRICNEMSNFSGGSSSDLQNCYAPILSQLTPANYTEELCNLIGDQCWYELAIRQAKPFLCTNINSASYKQTCELSAGRASR